MKKIAVMGYGTVGQGVVEVVLKNKDLISERIGEEIQIKYVLDLREFPGDPAEHMIVHDFDTILNDEEIEVVVETIGGTNAAYQFVKSCLLAGKSVATSNKALVAEYGAELLQLAKDKNVNFLFEASVGGGIPIIRPLNTSLTGDHIDEISGILNGTTNYMMTKMFYEGADYNEVLKKAQDKGFAELNPEADVEGHDACRKIAILSSVITNKTVDFNDIYCEGITGITTEDMKYAKEMEMTIKLLAISKNDETGLEAMVAPFLIDENHPLYNVNGVFNSVFVHGNALGDGMFYGSGAGKLPTASAVVGDVVDALRNKGKTIMPVWDVNKLALKKHEDTKRKFFLRIKGDGKAKEADVLAMFPGGKIQSLSGANDEFGVITDVMSEGMCAEKIAALGTDFIHMIRVEESL
ncbi:homoserine dehydrogenase [Aequitasia blattaphilus]|uniref:Homoserine dehydrogenase n=1 Tax=Aequitasia blattaphilus TaxID=2949332 RepID=A0ABT1E6H5_9FIRM|nr:homoserine dehydrogenase [Aequitasia blattaphilus]MCP1101438.1 homoserine dehydrogenase [Aequitasia blattaphilus]MCR8614078.1 homoserine dehydrogenase [Aequitasia blattaphilus]